MSTTVQKWGNSLGIRIPRSIAEQTQLREGSEVELDTTGGLLTIRPKRRRKHRLADLLSKAKGRSPHSDVNADGPVGRELL